MPGDKITELPSATSLAGNEITVVVQGGTTKQVSTAVSRNPIGNAGGDLVGSYPNPTLAAVTIAQASVGSTSLIPVITTDAKGRVTALSTAANPQGTVTNVTAGTGLSGGPITSTGSLNVVYGNAAGTAAQGNDNRFSTIPVAASTLPLADGAVSVGTSSNFARADHVHPQASVSLTGDITGVGSGSVVTSLANITSAQVNVGGVNKFPTISVDAKGRVTSLSETFVPPTAITGLTGDVTATGPGVVPASLSASGVTAGSYGYASTGMIPTITVDSKGRVTGASQEAIIIPENQSSVSSRLFSYSENRPFVFSNPTNVPPYKVGQFVTAITPQGYWMSGLVTACTVNDVTFAVSSLSGVSAIYSSWTIKPGFQLAVRTGAGASPTNGQVLAYNSAAGYWQPSAASASNAAFLQGFAISTASPSSGNALVWDGNAWTPTAGGAGANATSIIGYEINPAGIIDDGVLSWDQSANKWLIGVPDAQKLTGRAISSAAPSNGNVLAWDNTAQHWAPSAAGANATSIQGVAINTAAPATGQALVYDGSEWSPAAPPADATAIQTIPVTTTTPTSGQGLSYNGTSWTPSDIDAVKLQSQPVSTTAPTASQALVFNGTSWAPSDVDAAKLQSQPISTTSPSTSQALVFNGTSWEPAVVNAVQLQGSSVSSATPSANNLLKWDGTSWAPFDGVAIPNWNVAVSYATGDRVWYDGKIWVSTTAGSGQTPSTGSTYWAENIGSSSAAPSNQSTPVYWLRITTPAGDGYMPIYV